MYKVIADWVKIKPGTKVRVIANTSTHNVPLGTVLTLKKISGNTMTTEEKGNLVFNPVDIIPMVNTPENLKESLDKIKKSMISLESAIKILEENKSEDISEQELDQLVIMSVLDNTEMAEEDKIAFIKTFDGINTQQF